MTLAARSGSPHTVENPTQLIDIADGIPVMIDQSFGV